MSILHEMAQEIRARKRILKAAGEKYIIDRPECSGTWFLWDAEHDHVLKTGSLKIILNFLEELESTH